MSRRNFLQVLLVAGAGLLLAALYRVLGRTFHLVPTRQPISMSPVRPPLHADRIKNIIILIQENHTFDSLFAEFPGANGSLAGAHCPDRLPADPPHRHVDAILSESATTTASRCSYSEVDVPNYWKTARSFTLCDNYFSEVRGPSHPNYWMMIAGQSPSILTPSPTDLCPDFCLDIPVLPNRLDSHNLSWRDYGGIFSGIKSVYQQPEISNYHSEKFFKYA